MQTCTRCLMAAVFGIAVASMLLYAGQRSATAKDDATQAARSGSQVAQPRAIESNAPAETQSLAATVRQVAWQDATPGGDSAAPAALPDMGWVGVMLEDSDAGVRVSDVFPAGPAAFGGLRAGDILVKVGKTAVDHADSASKVIEKLKPGVKCTVTVRRQGEDVELALTPRSLREFHGAYVREMLSRDPRHPNYANFPGIAETDMTVELVRRLFEQNQRLETAIRDVHQEVSELRKEIQSLRK